MEKIVVTAGQPFTDIDSLACAIAYTELLTLEGKDAEAVLPGLLNKSITETIKGWGLNFNTKSPTTFTNHHFYVLVDISEPKYFANFVKEKDIIEVYDHRYGFEKHWKEKLGVSARIEVVGSCATLIWEEFEKRISPLKISETSAKLLSTAIISNTLNFNATVTTQRDRKAYEKLKSFSNLSKDWVERYFEDQEKESLKDPINAIANDAKGIGYKLKIGQLEFWDSRKFVFKHLKEIEKVLGSLGNKNWFFTSPSISEGKNYLYTKNPKMKILLEKTINAEFDGDIGTTSKLWLRKEIIKELQSKNWKWT